MNKIFQICEIAATVLETAILLEFINKLLGSKLLGIRNILQLLCAFALINGYMITSAHISVKYSAVLDLFGILLYVVYTLIFMKGSVIYRIITPILSIMTILFINLIVSITASNVLNYAPNDLLESGNVLRIFLLFITKFSFFILTRFVLKVVKPKEAFLDKHELMAVSVIFIISVMIVGFFSEVYYSDSRNGTIDKFLIILLVGLVVINIIAFILFGIIARKNREKMKYTMLEMQ